MSSLINWLVAIGCMLIGSGVGVWGLTDVNKSIAIWLIGFPGAVCLVVALGFEFQKIASDGNKPNEGTDRRAYVFVTDGDVANPAGGIATVFVNIKNTGQTPARDLTWRAKFEVRMIGDEHKIVLDPDAVGVKQTLPPGESLSYKYTFPTWDFKIDALLAAETAAIFALGEIRYKDNAGVDRFTDYLLKSGGRFGIKTGVSPGKFATVEIKSN